MKHTPGPWLTAIQTCHAGGVATVYNTADGWVEIWTENWAVTGMGPDEQSANAKLIAAAPDLLEALQFVMSAHGEQLDLPFEQAQKAIAKATGEQA